jgi:hypothetical protein
MADPVSLADKRQRTPPELANELRRELERLIDEGIQNGMIITEGFDCSINYTTRPASAALARGLLLDAGDEMGLFN